MKQYLIFLMFFFIVGNGFAQEAVRVGETVPLFSAVTDDDQIWSLKDFLGRENELPIEGNALMAAIYLVTMGKQGLKEVAEQCVKKAHYAATEIAKSNHYSLAFNQPFFKEFAIKSSVAVDDMNAKLLKKGILGGYNLGNDYEQYQDTVLLCVTEKRTKTEIDRLVAEMAGI